MALLNGHASPREQSPLPTQYLGKRKRTETPERNQQVGSKVALAQGELQDALQLIKGHSTAAALLKYPLPNREGNNHVSKRQKMEYSDPENGDIESRILNEQYHSLDDLIGDIEELKATISRVPAINSVVNADIVTTDHISAALDLLNDLQSGTAEKTTNTQPKSNGEDLTKPEAPVLSSSQILSLRSQTEHGLRQLFSGLPQSADSTNVDARRLPNGFEFTEVLSVDRNERPSSRKFGDVFAPHRSTKTLEMPRSTRSSRGNSINFMPPFENLSAPGRHDYKHTNLDTGLWLNYSIEETSNPENREQPEQNRKKPSTNALFKAVFSTFAPSTDNSHSIISDLERSQQWWKKHKKPVKGLSIFANTDPVETASQDMDDKISDEDLEATIANFIPEDYQGDDTDDLLEDISDMIQTLSSYQSMRDLEVAKGPTSASRPSKDEQEMYELLRTQLQLLVSNLPPFAVAKLDGDQLEQLNVSTHMLVSTPEFVGTAHVDDYTLRRNRAAQVAASAVGRNTASVQSRPTYGTPASAYNAQARAYNNISSSAYSARPPTTTMYNTPRPAMPTQTGSYTQPPFRTGPMIHTPSVQQFQRPAMNGYGHTATPTPQTSYLQRPSQPGYQQRVPDSVTTYSRPDIVHKPISNGDVPQYQQRQHVTTAATVQSQTTPDNIKQRQASDTPQIRAEALTTITAGS